jgi:formylglycine-generating enzyme required for sulfatase activity
MNFYPYFFSFKTLIIGFLTLMIGLISQEAYCQKTQKIQKLPKFPEVIFVKGGSFQMGSNDGDSDERPIHKVKVTDFQIGKYEVTVSQYRAFCQATKKVMPKVPSWAWKDDHPIVNVTWKDALAYCEWLSKETKKKYRLPTEAEWEYAAKGGEKSQNFTYSGSNDLNEIAWFGDNSENKTHPIGKKKPNELGIYDMSGNVFEWCSDYYHEKYYANSPVENPQGANAGEQRVLRGGSWYGNGKYGCRVAIRVPCIPDSCNDYDGFRIVCEVDENAENK